MAATIDFGIDLGTTNSSIALCRRGDVRVFQTTDLMNVTPSVVYVSKSGRMLVGKKAYDIWVQDPENTQAEFKRWMGYNDKLKFPASGRDLSAEELSAEVLKSLRADAERQTQERIGAAVITVPAAFGRLQCDATGRAARMAGFELSPLLQEPIAAAVAYGASPGARDQRWMVFDLGGGTLDIAVISTRNSRLAVLEHQGNNRLGGKDIDRAIAEALIFAPLSTTFRLPNPQTNAAAYGHLMRKLIRHAEQAKIALSSAPEVTVDLFDIGEDLDGKSIEASMTLKRADIERSVAPIIEQCLDLARRALDGARISGAELDRILLVGGPTQMPMVRNALSNALGARLDHSLDPMTVVAHGAALYAATLENTVSSAETACPAAAEPPPGVVAVQLAYERASGTPQSPVAGILPAGSRVHDVKIDAAGGLWTSGWIAVADGCFQVDVVLNDTRPMTRYTLSARDRRGNPLTVTPGEFEIAYRISMGAPPLPHAIAIELSTINGVPQMDAVFDRHCPLPAEVKKTYKAERALRPSDIGATLPIKFWEIQVSEDPQERWWAGCVHIRADRVKRPIPEGADLQLLVKIDASRKIAVEVFVPVLNQSISGDVYIPDAPDARSHLMQQLDLCFARLDHIRAEIYRIDRTDLTESFDDLQVMAETISERIGSDPPGDPDLLLKHNAALRTLRMQLARLEEPLGIGSASQRLIKKLEWEIPIARQNIAHYGQAAEQEQFRNLEDRYERYLDGRDARGLIWVQQQIWVLHSTVIENQIEYWQRELSALKEPAVKYVNVQEAAREQQNGDAARAAQDLSKLRSACKRLYGLRLKGQNETDAEQSAQSGLRE